MAVSKRGEMFAISRGWMDRNISAALSKQFSFNTKAAARES